MATYGEGAWFRSLRPRPAGVEIFGLGYDLFAAGVESADAGFERIQILNCSPVGPRWTTTPWAEREGAGEQGL